MNYSPTASEWWVMVRRLEMKLLSEGIDLIHLSKREIEGIWSNWLICWLIDHWMEGAVKNGNIINERDCGWWGVFDYWLHCTVSVETLGGQFYKKRDYRRGFWEKLDYLFLYLMVRKLYRASVNLNRTLRHYGSCFSIIVSPRYGFSFFLSFFEIWCYVRH